MSFLSHAILAASLRGKVVTDPVVTAELRDAVASSSPPAALHPADDYDWIVKGGTYQVLTAEVKGERKPRIDLSKPENSLILLKATGSVAHGGGRRFTKDSPE